MSASEDLAVRLTLRRLGGTPMQSRVLIERGKVGYNTG